MGTCTDKVLDMATHDEYHAGFERHLGVVEPLPTVPQRSRRISKEKAMEEFNTKVEETLEAELICTDYGPKYLDDDGVTAVTTLIEGTIVHLDKRTAANYLDNLRKYILNWLQTKSEASGKRCQKPKDRHGNITGLNSSLDFWRLWFSEPGTKQSPTPQEIIDNLVFDKWIEYLVRLTSEVLIYQANGQNALSKAVNFNEAKLQDWGIPDSPDSPRTRHGVCAGDWLLEAHSAPSALPQGTYASSTMPKKHREFCEQAENVIERLCTNEGGLTKLQAEEFSAFIKNYLFNERSLSKTDAAPYLDALRRHIVQWLQTKSDASGKRCKLPRNRNGDVTPLTQAMHNWQRWFSMDIWKKDCTYLEQWIDYLVSLTGEVLIYISNGFHKVQSESSKFKADDLPPAPVHPINRHMNDESLDSNEPSPKKQRLE